MAGKFIQITSLPQTGGGAALYALDESGQVWLLDPQDTREPSPRERWQKVTAEREG